MGSLRCDIVREIVRDDCVDERRGRSSGCDVDATAERRPIPGHRAVRKQGDACWGKVDTAAQAEQRSIVVNGAVAKSKRAGIRQRSAMVFADIVRELAVLDDRVRICVIQEGPAAPVGAIERKDAITDDCASVISNAPAAPVRKVTDKRGVINSERPAKVENGAVAVDTAVARE